MSQTTNLKLNKATDTDIPDVNVHLNPNWDAIDNELALSGVTAARPTTNLYAGKRYFDTTIMKPIWLATLSPSVWVDATGTTV